MTEQMFTAENAVPPRRGAAGLLFAVTTGWALAGALVFCVLVAMSLISIVGRKLIATPVVGDIELLMMGCAVASASFLPLCEMEDNHVRVDALTSWMGVRGRAVLDAISHTLLFLASALITWRTGLYVLEMQENTEVSTLLQVPLWIPVLLIVPSLLLLTLAALYRMTVSAGLAQGVRP
nr:TRAP transporter small permease [uncultured Rhodoferax sp.]